MASVFDDLSSGINSNKKWSSIQKNKLNHVNYHDYVTREPETLVFDCGFDACCYKYKKNILIPPRLG